MSGRKTFGGSAGGGKKGSNLQFQRHEPSFLKKLKEQVGYKSQAADVESKFASEDQGRDDREDRDDEAPTVVVLRKGDLTAEEAAKERLKEEAKKLEEDELPPDDGKIRFKKPIKRHAKAKDDEGDAPLAKKKEKKVQKQLLSFNDDDDDE